MDEDLRRAINQCRSPKSTGPGCLNFDCVMHGLNQIDLVDVLTSIEATGALAACRKLNP